MSFAALYGGLEFPAAIRFFRRKLNVPAKRWNDLWRDEHATGFMVAGAVKADLLSDFRSSVDRAISEGTTLAQFQKAFDEIVARNGWSHRGHRNWRSRIIYETNVRTAYAAGRWHQMTSPLMRKRRPYLEYRHGDSVTPREQHLAWDGLVLPSDDPWWHTHYPPNGWGCKCRAFAVGDRDLKRMGKTGPDQAPEVETYAWTDRKTGKTHEVPVGVDPGWDYNVGTGAEESYKKLAGKLDLMDDELAGYWMAEFVKSPAFDAFIDGAIPGEFPVAALAEAYRRMIGAENKTVWMSRDTVAKNRKAHPDLSMEVYRRLPDIITQADVVVQDGDRSEVFIRMGGAIYHAAIKTTETGRALYLTSLRKTTMQDVERMKRKGKVLKDVL